MQGQSHTRGCSRWLIAVCALAVSACQTPATTGESGQTAGALPVSRELAQAERLAHELQFAAAAQQYEELAQRSSATLRNRLYLRAANEWLRANDLGRGEALLQQVGDDLPSSDRALHAVALARVALLKQQPEAALNRLDQIPQPWPRDLAPAILEVRVLALFAVGKPAGAVIAALDREHLLSDPADIMRNRRMIWDGVQRSVANGANMQAPAGSNRIVSGWLDIGKAALMATRNPFDAHPAIDAWRMKYPEHPANEFLNQQVMPQLRAAVTFPPQIALVLPFTGKEQIYGQIVRDGFVAALLQLPAEQRPIIRMYDSAPGVMAAYAQAVADGANFVVGPLIKDDVARLVASQQISVPTLVLNSVPDNTQPLPKLFQFSLDPTEEARQVARHVAMDGLTHGVALLPRSDWGDRVYKAFATELQAYGGTIVGQSFYDRRARDYGEPVTSALLIDESIAREHELESIIGTQVQFEPRARGDVQFIFMGANPAQGRLLRPTIRFHLLDQVPVFATSSIYEPDASANTDLDGVIFPDMPWLLDPSEQSMQLRAELNRYWPGRARERGRLYAFGYDTFRLIPLLLSQSTDTPTSESNGVTGRLSIDKSGHVSRELDWAQIINGRPQLVGNGAVATTALPSAAPQQH